MKLEMGESRPLPFLGMKVDIARVEIWRKERKEKFLRLSRRRVT